MNVLALQIDIDWENKRANFQKVRDLLAKAAPAKDSLVVLPEMFATGFTMNMEACAERYGGDTENFLGQTAKDFEVSILAGAAMRGKNGQVRNKALAFAPDGTLLGFYSKMKLFSPGGEHAHCEAGKGPTVFQWQGWRVCPFVCYDLRFPEIFRQATASHRPELFILIANWPAKRLGHWLKLLPARAIENQAYVVGVNRVGKDPFYAYAGRSLILDPHGEVMADAGETEGWAQARLDIDALRKYREGLPFLNDLGPMGGTGDSLRR